MFYERLLFLFSKIEEKCKIVKLFISKCEGECEIELRKLRNSIFVLESKYKVNKKFHSKRRMYYVAMFKIRIRCSTAFKIINSI